MYAKKYDPIKSTVELNPIRAKIYLVFPESGDSFDMDIELRGVRCSVRILSAEWGYPGTKNLSFRRAKVMKRARRFLASEKMLQNDLMEANVFLNT